ncbi:hypothetical protein C7S17_6447 [Burkholderia thailandensis]|nr:hypothetical protein [Burkholderia thailandensis]
MHRARCVPFPSHRASSLLRRFLGRSNMSACGRHTNSGTMQRQALPYPSSTDAFGAKALACLKCPN